MSDADGLSRAFERADERSKLAADFCESPAMKRARTKSLAATYRCAARRCVLAYVYSTARGVIVRQPPYKLSPGVNAASSSESGRASNTRDGERRWKARSFFPTEALEYSMNCDHVRSTVSGAELIDAATRRAGDIMLG